VGYRPDPRQMVRWTGPFSEDEGGRLAVASTPSSTMVTTTAPSTERMICDGRAPKAERTPSSLLRFETEYGFPPIARCRLIRREC